MDQDRLTALSMISIKKVIDKFCRAKTINLFHAQMIQKVDPTQYIYLFIYLLIQHPHVIMSRTATVRVLSFIVARLSSFLISFEHPSQTFLQGVVAIIPRLISCFVLPLVVNRIALSHTGAAQKMHEQPFEHRNCLSFVQVRLFLAFVIFSTLFTITSTCFLVF